MARAHSLASLLADFGDKAPATAMGAKPAVAATVVATPAAKQAPAQPKAASPVDLMPPSPDNTLRDRVVALEAELAGARAEHAVAIERLAAIHQSEIAERIEAGIAEIGARLSEHVETAVAGALAPLVTVALAKKSATALAARLGELAVPGAAIRLRLKGNRALFDAVSARLSARDWAIEFTEAETVDLTAEIDQTVIETRIGEWASLIEGDPEW